VESLIVRRRSRIKAGLPCCCSGKTPAFRKTPSPGDGSAKLGPGPLQAAAGSQNRAKEDLGPRPLNRHPPPGGASRAWAQGKGQALGRTLACSRLHTDLQDRFAPKGGNWSLPGPGRAKQGGPWRGSGRAFFFGKSPRLALPGRRSDPGPPGKFAGSRRPLRPKGGLETGSARWGSPLYGFFFQKASKTKLSKV